jgi:hypothetical protein
VLGLSTAPTGTWTISRCGREGGHHFIGKLSLLDPFSKLEQRDNKTSISLAESGPGPATVALVHAIALRARWRQ